MIRLRNLHKSYTVGRNKLHVLKGIDLDIGARELVAVMGASGSGKSTLMNILGLLDRYDEGEYTLDGVAMGALSETRAAQYRSQYIGFVFQSFHLIPNMTALENVAVPLELAGRRNAFAEARAELTAVGLGERLSHYPGQLSGGEQQRVAIARALAPKPKLVIADEPTGNLDQATGKQIADLLFATARERAATLMLVTHDPVLAKRCDRVITMRSGRVESAARADA